MDRAAILAQLAPIGVLRAGINMSNGLLISTRSADGQPDGVSPGMARAIADRLGVPLRLVPFPKPDLVADAAGTDQWDICLVGAEPARAAKIRFTAAYAEIEATYLVPAASAIRTIADADRPGISIAVNGGTAYGHWLHRSLANATLLRLGDDDAVDAFRTGQADALAGLKTQLITLAEAHPGTRIVPGRFTAVQQAIGTESGHDEGAQFLHDFVETAKSTGLVARLIAQYGVVGLAVAPASDA